MIVKGKHEFKVSSRQLWKYLMDAEVLAKITPGVSKLEELGDDKYKSYSVIKIGPVKSTFTGKLQVVEKDQPRYFQIKMEQLSRIGNAHVTVDMNIEEKEGGIAELVFDGKANLSGVIARTGQRVLSGVANAITREVFSALEKHIEENRESEIPIQPIQSESIQPTEKVESTESIESPQPISNEPQESLQTPEAEGSIEPNETSQPIEPKNPND